MKAFPATNIMILQLLMVEGAVLLLSALSLGRAHHNHSDSVLVICNKSQTVENLQIGARGNISLPSTRDVPSQPCQLFMKACPRCRIKLEIINLRLPPCHKANPLTHMECIHQCDHITVFEPSYRESSWRNYFSSNSSSAVFESLSSSVQLKLCNSGKYIIHSFLIQFYVLEKKNVISGSCEANERGSILSPNFPHGYAVGSEVYVYILRNSDAAGFIFLVMDDWDLASTSKVQFYSDENETSLLSSHSGATKRPVITSKGSLLYIKFEPGHGLSSRIDNMGFTATYWFINSSTWPGRPVTDCGDYFKYHRGGEITFHGQGHQFGSHYDCIWVITKSSAYEKVQIRVNRLHLVSEMKRNLSLILRSGLTSLSPMIEDISVSSSSANQNLVFTSEAGFYVRFSGHVMFSDDISLIFTSFTPVTSASCVRSVDFRCGNGKCVDGNLVCDGVDHCGDGSDEAAVCRESVVVPTEVRSYSRLCREHEFSCLDGKRCLSQSYVCDKWLDCKDGSDEYFCSRTTGRPAPTTELDCGPRMWRCASGHECVFTWQRCDEYPHCHDRSDERNCTLRGSHPLGMTPPWNVLAPVGLSICIGLFICVIIFCIRSHYKELNGHHPRGHCGVTTVSGSVRRRDHRCRSVCSHTNSTSPLTLSPNSDTTFTLTSPPSYEEALRLSADSGMFNSAFVSSDSDMRSMALCPPPAYTPSPTDATVPQEFPNVQVSVQTVCETTNEDMNEDVNDCTSSLSHNTTYRQETETLLPGDSGCEASKINSYSDQDNLPPSPVHSVSSQEETSVLLDSPSHQYYDPHDRTRRHDYNKVTNRPRSRTLANDELYTIVPTDDNGNLSLPDILTESSVKHSSIIHLNMCLSIENEVNDNYAVEEIEKLGDLNQNVKHFSRTKTHAVKQGKSMPNLLNSNGFIHDGTSLCKHFNTNNSYDLLPNDNGTHKHMKLRKNSSEKDGLQYKGTTLRQEDQIELRSDKQNNIKHQNSRVSGNCDLKKARSLGHLTNSLSVKPEKHCAVLAEFPFASDHHFEARKRTNLKHVLSLPNLCLSKREPNFDISVVEFEDSEFNQAESDQNLEVDLLVDRSKSDGQGSEIFQIDSNYVYTSNADISPNTDDRLKTGKTEHNPTINLRCFGGTNVPPQLFKAEATCTEV